MLGDTQQNSVTANGSTPDTGTKITASIVNVTTVTAANSGVELPLAVSTPYSWIMVRNSDSIGADTLNVWPVTGDAINGAVSTPIGVAAGTGKVFCKINSTGWITT